MDSGSQCSVVEENELALERVSFLPADQNTATPTGTNCFGSYEKDELSLDNGTTTPDAGYGVPPDSAAEKFSKNGELVNSPPPTADSPTGVTPPTTKGYGLKKWRRIKRDFQKDTSPIADSNKAMKRPSKPGGMMFDDTADGSRAHRHSLNSKFVGVPNFTAGADSDNSEDRNSRSSTAASIPKFWSELPSASGYASEKNRIKNVIGINSSGSAKAVQQGKGRVETSKKQRGDQIKIEIENSHSSVESDSISSNFIFTQANVSATSNGKKSSSYDGECSDDAEESDRQFSEEATGHSKQNSGDFDDRSQDYSATDVPWKSKKEKHENHHSSVDHDPLVESIISLRSLQESLKREVEKFAEIGKEAASPPSANGSSSHYDQLHPELICQIPPGFLQLQILTLTENVKNLEDKLEEARATAQAKEAKVSELEAAVNCNKSPKEETDSEEVESEMEELFRLKIEAEIEYLAIAREIEKLRVEEQQSLANVESSMISKLGQVEAKAAELKKQAAAEAYNNLVPADIKGVDEVYTYQKQTGKASFFLILQLVLFLFVCWLTNTRLSSDPEFLLPT